MRQTNKIFRRGQQVIFRLILFLLTSSVLAQTNQQGANGVTTYVNPVLAGSHPDQTLLRVGNDYYTAGSSFHWAPNFTIFHSTDLVHWEAVSNVVSPAWSGLVGEDGPKDGTWQGALAYFDNKFWAFFFIHGKGQYFCTAANMRGPWSTPALVRGSIGYDNAVFVNDDGRAYMLMKNGPTLNRIQELGKDGQLTGPVMNMDWVNQGQRFSWAEGPKMCKRNGRYYYFVAGNVYGGQYVLSSPRLTADESSWTVHGNFFRGTVSGDFAGPNHITNPVQIPDGTWWCLAHSYRRNNWDGQGRQSMLFQVHWDANGVPYSNNPNGGPLTAPDLPGGGRNYKHTKSDFFTSATRNPHWHFFNTSNVQKASLSARPGYLRLTPGNGTTHIMQRDHSTYYSLVTKVEINATSNGQQAGLRLMNGEDNLFINLYSGYNNGKKLGIAFEGRVITEINNPHGNTVWLKLERSVHNMTGYYSADGLNWTRLGNAVDISALDKSQPNDNAWVGNSVALYATNQIADFDQFSYQHGFDPIKVAGYHNYFGTSVVNSAAAGRVVTYGASGDWCMLPGVTMESDGVPANSIEVNAASANSNGSLEIWIDNIGGPGTKIATIPIASSGGADVWRNYTAGVTVSGQHDLYFKFIGPANSFRLNTVKFVANGSPVIQFTSPADDAVFASPGPVRLEVAASDMNGSITNVRFYNGTTLLNTDNTAPYSYDWMNVAPGTYEIRAIATDNEGNTGEATITIRVNVPQSPYGGAAHKIPGTIQLEEYDHGGNGFAYYDATPGSQVSPVVNFRTDEDEDIEACTDAGGGYNIGYATAGEWLEYTVNVEAAGTYDLELRVACNGTGRTLSIAMDGENIAGNVSIPNTGGWQSWQTVRVRDIELTTGTKVMRVTMGEVDYVNMNYVTFRGVNVSLPPVVSLTGPSNNAGYGSDETVRLTATASDSDGSVSKVDFYAGELLIGSAGSAPYAIDWSRMNPGVYVLTAVATDNKGISTTSSPVTVTIRAVQAPFHGVAHLIPGRIEAEEYDLGGEGLGYHEANINGNEGKAPFRNDEVDIELTQDEEGVYNIAYILEGEWLQYTVDVMSSGVYDLNLRMAADGAGKTLHIEIDGVDVTGPVQVPNTGGWQTWETFTVRDVSLTAGEHVLRIVFDANYMNLNYVEFVDVVTGLQSAESAVVEVYPNPFAQRSTQLKCNGNFNYQITNISGVLLEKGMGANEQQIGAGLDPGIYFLKVEYDNNLFIQKIQKQ